MAWFRRAAAPTFDIEALTTAVAETVKASMLALPPGASVYQPLPRDVFDAGAFGPGMPLVPVGIDPRVPNLARPEPRRSEFQSSINMQVSREATLVPFQVLRDVAEKVDVIRACVKVRQSQILALDWDIVLTAQAVKRVMADDAISSPGKASQLARQRFEPQMASLRAWWEKPDRFNGQDFSAWMSVLLEEQLVLDAATLYPRRKLSGEVVAIEILDGATIKVLLDHRGSTPVPPAPAYQQILYGFPRGEFTASDTGNDDGYLFDQLVYRPRHPRTWSPYGKSEVEVALSAADLYLKRMSWIRGEFTDGTTPDTWLELPDTSKLSASDIRAFEAAINADLSGQDAERRHLRMLPPGAHATAMKNFGETYSAMLDEFFIKIMCTCFDVMPTQIGFPPNSGIGGKGHQEGEANSAQRKAVRPTARWIENLLTDISRDYLGMPAELEFKLLGYEIEDQDAAEKVIDSEVRGGRKTVNEGRSETGLALFDFPEADEPFLVTGSGLVFLRGAIAGQAAAAGTAPPPGAGGAPGPLPAGSAPPSSALDPRPADQQPAGPTATDGSDGAKAGDAISADAPVPDGFLRVAGHLRRKPGAIAETAKFVSFARNRTGGGWRDFTFTDVDPATAAEFNAAGRAGNMDLIKALAVDVGKALPGL